jgi:hypothetical protein
MKQFLHFALLGSVVLFSACQEDVIEANSDSSDSLRVVDSVSAPIIRLVDSKVPTTLKFGFSVAAHQINDTLYYLVLPDSLAAPSADELFDHAEVTELPMEGSYFRSTFLSDLSAESKYVVYATIKRQRTLSEVVNLTLATGKDSGTVSSGNPPDGTDEPGQETPPAEEPPAEEPTPGENPPPNPQDTTAAPVLEPRGTPQRDVISLAVMVNGDQIDGTLHYLYFTEDKNPETLTPQEVVDHRFTEEVPMGGATIRKFNFPATSKTKYYIYGVMQVGNKLSRVVLIERSTV